MSTLMKGVAVSVGLAVAAASAAFLVLDGDDPSSSLGSVGGTSTPSGLPVGTGTTTARAADPHLEPGPDAPVATDGPVSRDGAVVVVLTHVDWSEAAGPGVEAAGFVQGIVASGGTCTLTLTRAGTSVSAQSSAEADATTTACGALVVPGGSLTAGSWQATITYSSPTADGTSDAATVEVPRQ